MYLKFMLKCEHFQTSPLSPVFVLIFQITTDDSFHIYFSLVKRSFAKKDQIFAKNHDKNDTEIFFIFLGES